MRDNKNIHSEVSILPDNFKLDQNLSDSDGCVPGIFSMSKIHS